MLNVVVLSVIMVSVVVPARTSISLYTEPEIAGSSPPRQRMIDVNVMKKMRTCHLPDKTAAVDQIQEA
jgi:hypothetical protein